MGSKYFKTFSNLYSYSCKQSHFVIYLTIFIHKNRMANYNNRYKFFRLKQQFSSRWPYLLMWSLPFSISPKVKKELESKQKKEIKNAILEADVLFESNKYKEASSVLLRYKESKDVEILWRLSRALYNQAQSSVISKDEKKRLIHEAYIAVSEAIDLDNIHWAVHKWMSVLLDAHSAYDGIKARVMQLERVKNHMLKAVELNPNDATTFYMLGSWCYQIADMPWFQRKIAATIFAEPPTSSFEEALQFFSKAEEIDPKFYSQNLLMLGKTLLKLNRPLEAAIYLSQARDYPHSTEEDIMVRKEAAELLKKLEKNEN